MSASATQGGHNKNGSTTYVSTCINSVLLTLIDARSLRYLRTSRVEEFLLRLRCSPLYINMVFDTSLWGAMAFWKCRLNVSKRHRIVTKFGMSVDGGKTQLFQVQIFDICPQKILAPLWIFRYHYGQWDRKLQMAIKLQGIDQTGWNLVHM